MRLVPRKTLILRKLPLRAELHMRMAHLTYPTLLRQIRGALQVAILRMRTAGGERLFAELPRYRYSSGACARCRLLGQETFLRQIQSVRVSL